jgi:hypothetical protein
MAEDRVVIRRKRVKHETSFKERLLKGAREARDAAELLPPGKARDQLLRKARANETAANIDEWISSPGLRPPVALTGAAPKDPRRTG